MCLLIALMSGGPRLAIVLWWLLATNRWEAAFDTFLVPFLGFVFLPWTTLMFVIVAPGGDMAGYDWIWLGIAFLMDMVSLGSGGREGRSRYGRS